MDVGPRVWALGFSAFILAVAAHMERAGLRGSVFGARVQSCLSKENVSKKPFLLDSLPRTNKLQSLRHICLGLVPEEPPMIPILYPTHFN